MNVFLLSGFNPLNLDSWRIDRYYKSYKSPRKRNWKKGDEVTAINWYNETYGNQPYILSCHSDGGTIAHKIAHSDTRCVGLHCHSALFTREETVRDIPVLFTYTRFDLTGMGIVTRKAFRYYHKKLPARNVAIINAPRTTIMGHSYGACLPILDEWCRMKFSLKLDLKNPDEVL